LEGLYSPPSPMVGRKIMGGKGFRCLTEDGSLNYVGKGRRGKAGGKERKVNFFPKGKKVTKGGKVGEKKKRASVV